MSESEFVSIGKVGRPFGLKGDFYVVGRDEPFPKNFTQIRIGNTPESSDVVTIERVGLQSGKPRIKLKEFSDRDAAQALVGQLIWVPRSEIKVDSDKEFLWSDLVGKQVVDCNGLVLGKVDSIYNVGASDIMVVSDNKKTLEIALVKDYINFDDLSVSVNLNVDCDTFEGLWQ